MKGPKDFKYSLDILGPLFNFGVILADSEQQVLNFNDSAVAVFEQDFKCGDTLSSYFKDKEGMQQLFTLLKAQKRMNGILCTTSSNKKVEISMTISDDGHFLMIAKDMSQLGLLQEQIEIERKRNQETRRLMSIGMMAAGISHEINNPLAIIKSSAYLIKKFIESESHRPNEIKSLSESIDRTVARIGSIVESMRSLSGGNRVGRAFSPFDLLQAIEEAQKSLSGDQAVTITVESPQKKALLAYGLKSDFSQSLEYILKNAREHSGKDSKIEIIIKGPSRGKFEVHIQDCGLGIPEENKEKIWDPFFSTKEIGDGQGLGLPLARNLLQGMKGKLELLSSGPSGTKFSITIQCAHSNQKT